MGKALLHLVGRHVDAIAVLVLSLTVKLINTDMHGYLQAARSIETEPCCWNWERVEGMHVRSTLLSFLSILCSPRWVMDAIHAMPNAKSNRTHNTFP